METINIKSRTPLKTRIAMAISILTIISLAFMYFFSSNYIEALSSERRNDLIELLIIFVFIIVLPAVIYFIQQSIEINNKPLSFKKRRELVSTKGRNAKRSRVRSAKHRNLY